MIFRLIFLSTFSLFLSSCGVFSPQKRLNRLIRKHPELKTTVLVTVRDTITDTLQVVTPGVSIPITPIDIDKLRDTVYIDTNQLHIAIWTNEAQDSIFVDAKCDTVTVEVIREIPIEIEVPVEAILINKPRDKLRWFVYGFVSCVCLFAFLFIISDMIRRKTDSKKE